MLAVFLKEIQSMLDLIVIVCSSIVALIIGGLIGGLLYKSKLRQQDIYTAIELEKERQDRGELESTLRQTQQEVARLSRENKHISKALTQATQRNEQLSNTLTQENHAIVLKKENENREKLENALQQTQQEVEKERKNCEKLERAVRQTQQEVAQLSHEKEQLSSALTQENQYRETLEKKLAFSGTSGYPTLLNGLYSAKHLRTDIQRRDYLQELQGAARTLWREYRSTDISPDYSKNGLSRSVSTLLLFAVFSTCPLPAQPVGSQERVPLSTSRNRRINCHLLWMRARTRVTGSHALPAILSSVPAYLRCYVGQRTLGAWQTHCVSALIKSRVGSRGLRYPRIQGRYRRKLQKIFCLTIQKNG